MLTQRSMFGRLDRLASAVLFAGMGGSCQGIRMATGTSPLVAVNHCAHALRIHALNHPDVLHLREDVFDVVPAVAARGRKLDLLWLSPDCTHHSRARGGKPKESGRRSLASVAIDWAVQVRPRVIMLENVPEFLGWGPLDDAGHPIKERAGELFRDWCWGLQSIGYRLEYRVLCSADYGTPTSRRRFYLVARCDNQPIVWPEPTHGPGRAHPWRTAAECIDWSIPCPSIFDRKRPLQPATGRRIARGLVRFVIENPRPYLLCLTHGGRLEPIDEPMRTLTCAHRGERSIVTPFLARYHGEKSATEARVDSLESPLPTQSTENRFGLVTASIVHHRGESIGRDVNEPLPTVTATGQGHLGVVTAWMAKHYGNGVTGHILDKPLGSVTTVDHHSLCTASLSREQQDGGKRVGAFLLKYYGSGTGQDLRLPLDTVTTLDRFGLVTVVLDGEPWVITDIGMRMLQPRELARASGFPDSYVLEGTKGDQVARIGNAVNPQVAEALVRANFGLPANAGEDKT